MQVTHSGAAELPGRINLLKPRRARPATVRAWLYIGLAIGDCLLFVAAFLFCAWVIGPGIANGRNGALIALVPPIYLLCAAYRQAYSYAALTSVNSSWSRASVAAALAAGAMLLIGSALQVTADYPRLLFGSGWLVGWILMLAFRAGLITAVARIMGERLAVRVLIREDGVPAAPAGWIAVDANATDSEDMMSDPFLLHDLAAALAHVDQVVVSCRPDQRARWSTVLKGLGVDGELLVPELADVGLLRSNFGIDWPLLRVSVGPLNLRNRVLKRSFDLALALPLLLILAAPMLLLALAVKLDSRGPIFFDQLRIGQQNRLFKMLKYRSMNVEQADAGGHESAQPDDPRVTRLGRILRATSLDELPQLLNVVWGDMSLVGPRPHALASRAGPDLFWEVDSLYWTRHSVKPGITGLAQVRGFRGATHKPRDLRDRLRADLEYVADWSLWRDVAILAKTAFVMMHRNAY